MLWNRVLDASRSKVFNTNICNTFTTRKPSNTFVCNGYVTVCSSIVFFKTRSFPREGNYVIWEGSGMSCIQLVYDCMWVKCVMCPVAYKQAPAIVRCLHCLLPYKAISLSCCGLSQSHASIYKLPSNCWI